MCAVSPLPPPDELMRCLPVRGTPLAQQVARTRQRIRAILHGQDDRLLVLVGPWMLDGPVSAMAGARRLRERRERHAGTLEIVMRVDPATPWRPAPGRPAQGLREARERLLGIQGLGLPVGIEWQDLISPRYLGDLVCWAGIGAGGTESQVHRELASGLSSPVGFEPGSGGRVGVGLDALRTAARGHRYLGVQGNGRVAMLRSRGNPDAHLILGPADTPAQGACALAAACAELARAGLPARLVADCRHADPARRPALARALADSVAAGSHQVVGLHLAGPAPGHEDLPDLTELLERLAEAVARRRRPAPPGRNSRDAPYRHESVIMGLG